MHHDYRVILYVSSSSGSIMILSLLHHILNPRFYVAPVSKIDSMFSVLCAVVEESPHNSRNRLLYVPRL